MGDSVRSGGQTAGTETCAAGRERPRRLFGRPKAQKVGSLPLPPDFVVCPPLLFGFVSGITLVCGEHRVKTLVQAGLRSVEITFFTGFPLFLNQEALRL
jgi:hypothetical protein